MSRTGWHVAPPVFRTFLHLHEAIEHVYEFSRANPEQGAPKEEVMVTTTVVKKGELQRITLRWYEAEYDNAYIIDRIEIS